MSANPRKREGHTRSQKNASERQHSDLSGEGEKEWDQTGKGFRRGGGRSGGGELRRVRLRKGVHLKESNSKASSWKRTTAEFGDKLGQKKKKG